MACVELPEFPLQLLLKRHPDWAGRPVAVVDRDKPQGVILWVNEEARVARVRTGMRYSAGLSLAHTLHAGEVPPADVERGVAAVAERLRRFSPDVEPSRDEPGVFWLNASGLSYLHVSLARNSPQGAKRGRGDGSSGKASASQCMLGEPDTDEVPAELRSGEGASHGWLARPASGAGTGQCSRYSTEFPPILGRAPWPRSMQPVLPSPCPQPGVGENCGLGRWAREIVASLRRCGFRAAVAVGFTRFGTYAVARTLTPDEPVAVIPDPAVEQMQAGRVRLSRLGIDPALRDSLHKLGVRTVRAFLRLPPEGIRRRFGPRARRLHRLAAGDLWAPLQPQRVAEPLVARCDLDDPETDAVRLLFHIKRLLDRLLAVVRARHEALAELRLRLRLDRADAHTERLRPAAPTVDVVQLMNLVRLRLEPLALGAGVTEVRVAGRAVATAAVQQGLFVERPRRDRAAAQRALARVRAEFGDEAVVRALSCEAHLPEARFVWEPVGTVPPPEPREVACRPMVRRIHTRPLALPPGLEPKPDPDGRSVRDGGAGWVRDLAGPYLVSGGWWHSAVHREYYFVRTGDDDMLWVYYDRRRRRWRWQGRVE